MGKKIVVGDEVEWYCFWSRRWKSGTVARINYLPGYMDIKLPQYPNGFRHARFRNRRWYAYRDTADYQDKLRRKKR